MRLNEIELRLKAIIEEGKAEDSNLDELTVERDALLEERKGIMDSVEKRKALLDTVVNLKDAEIIKEFKEERQTMDKVINRESAEYRAAWLKDLQGLKLNETEQRDYTSAVNSSGGAIPTSTSEALFAKMVTLAPMLSEITLLRVAGNVNFSAEGVRNPALQHTENAAITASTDTLVKVSLTGYEFSKLLYISKTVQTMSINAFEGWLVDMIAEDIAVAIENAIINGDGSSAPKGIEKAATWSTASNLVELTGTFVLTYTKVLSMIAKLPARYDSNAKFLASKAMVYQGLANVVDTTGKPLLVNDAVGPYPFKVLGYPVIVSDKVAAQTLYLGDYKKVVGNLAQDVTVERDASAGFASNSIAYRGGAIFDCNIALADAFVKLTVNTY